MEPEKAAEFKHNYLDGHPELSVTDRQMTDLFSIYLADEDAATATDRASKSSTSTTAHTATVPNSTTRTESADSTGKTETAPGASATSASSADSAAILKQLESISSSLSGYDAKLSAMEKKFIPVEKLGEYRSEIAGTTLKLADDLANIRENHREEFGERLDRNAFEKFVNDQKAAGVGYKDLTAAHDAFVADKRVEKKIAEGVAAGVKQKTSAMEVPGQTQSVGMSAAQQVLSKARAEAAAQGGNNRAMAAAEKLRALRQGREDSGAAVQ